MWNFASKCLAGTGGLRFRTRLKTLTQSVQESSDDESSSIISKEDGLECPICCESFNIVENIPYVLWCGHSLCKNCILSLPWAIGKIQPLPVRLPLLISCPWCNLLSPRVVIKGTLMFPRKNYFLLWMVERMTSEKVKVNNDLSVLTLNDGQTGRSSGPAAGNSHVSLIRKVVVLLIEVTAKFPLVLIFLMIVLYAIPASAMILALYVLLTVLVAVPSFLVLYFSYPSLDWLVREIVG